MPYLVRIYSKKCQGWQVRGSKSRDGSYLSKMFSDGRYGGAEGAKTAADNYLSLLPQEVVLQYPHGFHQGKPIKRNSSGVNGVYRTHDYTKRHRIRRDYWAAHFSIDRFGNQHVLRHKRFYIDEHGEKEARQMAIEFRQGWEEAARKGVEAVKQFFDEYEMANS
jgi:hypothetical protein